MRIFTFIGIMAIAIGLAVGCADESRVVTDDDLGKMMLGNTERASEQVGVMVRTFNKMSPVAPEIMDGMEAGAINAADASMRAANVNGDGGGVVIDGESPHRSEVQEAFALVRYYSERADIDNDVYVQAVNDLKTKWDVLFVQAHQNYADMNAKIEIAKRTADIYFYRQDRLTAEIHDPEFRADLAANDLDQRETFANWSERADGLAEAAYKMMRDMEDVDVFLAKASLSAHFTALQRSTSKLPKSMTRLNDELDEFRDATRELNDSINNSVVEDDA